MAGRAVGASCARRVRLAALVVGMITCLKFASPVGAASTPGADEVQAFFDEYLPAQMKTHHVAGAVAAVVKDGSVLLAKGYGQADVVRRAPMDPDGTVLILGSLSKLFTWTAVMQLVERGQLDLDADVNRYLDFAIPATFPEPITLRHLMGHTAGFDDDKYGQMTPNASGLVPLQTWLRTHLPARVRRPGEFSSYGNYGAALAGGIVERVSGLSFDEYVEKNILSPLGMTLTTSRQPVPPGLQGGLSQCYRYVGGKFEASPTIDVALHDAPAGSFRSTAEDMARFMIAHLEGGGGVLTPQTVRLMHTRSFSHDPRINGMAHGFWELDADGERIIGHAGSHFIFGSVLLLFPERRLGVFVASNSEGGNAFVGGGFDAFVGAFVERFFSRTRSAIAPSPDFASRASRFAGSYHLTIGRSERTPEKLLGLVMAANVAAGAEGLMVSLPAGRKRFIETEPLVFRQADGAARIVFREDGQGRIAQAFYGPIPITALVKSHWYETPGFNLPLLLGCLVAFVSFIPAGVIGLVRDRRAGRSEPWGRTTTAAGLLASVAGLLAAVGAAASIFDIVGLYTGHLPLWPVVVASSVTVTLCASGLAVLCVVVWKRSAWGVARRAHLVLVTVAAAAFVWFLAMWNLLARTF